MQRTYSAAEQASIAQDIDAMRNAHDWRAVESIRRAMVGLDRWSDRAETAYGQARARLFGAARGSVRPDE